ncbi:hypothetical protein AALA13_18025 [Lachnospiraceae bacterium 50-23]|jgi:hypothetical protein|nr:hypothetical protein [Dorea sp.]
MSRFESKTTGKVSLGASTYCTCSGGCNLTCSGGCKYGCTKGCQAVCYVGVYKFL